MKVLVMVELFTLLGLGNSFRRRCQLGIVSVSQPECTRKNLSGLMLLRLKHKDGGIWTPSSYRAYKIEL